MLAYIIRRLIYLIPVLFVLTVVVFAFDQMLPGDIIDVMMGEEDIEDPEVRIALEKEFGPVSYTHLTLPTILLV